MRVVARDLQDLSVIGDDPVFEEVVSNIEVDASVEFTPSARQRIEHNMSDGVRRALNRARVLQGQDETEVDLVLSEALHLDDKARDNMSPAYDAELDRDANGGVLPVVQRGSRWDDEERNKPKYPNRSAFRVPQELWDEGSEDDEEMEISDVIREAGWHYTRGRRFWRRRAIAYTVGEVARDQVQPERFASDVPLGERLTFPALWDDKASARGRVLDYHARSMRIAGVSSAAEAANKFVHLALKSGPIYKGRQEWEHSLIEVDEEFGQRPAAVAEECRKAETRRGQRPSIHPIDGFDPDGSSAVPPKDLLRYRYRQPERFIAQLEPIAQRYTHKRRSDLNRFWRGLRVTDRLSAGQTARPADVLGYIDRVDNALAGRVAEPNAFDLGKRVNTGRSARAARTRPIPSS